MSDISNDYTYEYADKLYEILQTRPDTYVETGLISASKIGYTPLTAILRMIGVGSEFDGYTLGKFQRGHDLEYDIIKLMWGTPPDEGVWFETHDGTWAMWQYRPQESYRGTSVTIDLIEDIGDHFTIHEIKSANKMSWDKTAAAGYSKYAKEKKGETAIPEIKPHNALQAALQGLATCVDREGKEKPVKEVLVHYVNADDYRIITFRVDPEEYREQIDNDINAILEAFITKRFPVYVSRWGWDKGKYNNYAEYEKLNPDQIHQKLKIEHKDALDKFMMAEVKGDNIIYQEVEDESK